MDRNIPIDNIPIYFPGDTIRLRLRLEHEGRLANVWAAFERETEEEVRSLRDVVWTLSMLNPDSLRLLDRTGTQLVSEVLLEGSVLDGKPLPGTYSLIAVNGTPFGESDRSEKTVVAFDRPTDVRFKVAVPPVGERPRVTNWLLDWEPRSSGRGSEV